MTGCGDDGGATTTSTSTCRSRPTRRRATALGFDHHGASYRMLHCGCRRQYLYSLREDVLDSDVGHDADTGLGAWTATRGCEVGEGGTLELHAAMR